MRAVVQRVASASVVVDGQIVSAIEDGLLALVAFGKEDTPQSCSWMAKKLCALRIFEDTDGKMNRSLIEVEGSLLVVSNFTIYGDAQNGRRPSFVESAPFDEGLKLYELLLDELKATGIPLAAGTYGADMKVSLVNDGPVTLVIESP